MKNLKAQKREIRHHRGRAKIKGTLARPRLAVFPSNTHIYAQLIDDLAGATLVSASDIKIKKGKKVEKAREVGKLIAKAAKEKKISKVVFDRGGFGYAGRVKALAEEARKAGLNL